MVKSKIYIGEVWFSIEDRYYENFKTKLDSVLVLASLLDYTVEAKHYHVDNSIVVYFANKTEMFTLQFKIDKRRDYSLRSIHLCDKSGNDINTDYVWSPKYMTLSKLELLLN